MAKYDDCDQSIRVSGTVAAIVRLIGDKPMRAEVSSSLEQMIDRTNATSFYLPGAVLGTAAMSNQI